MPLYTRTGDRGETGLADGTRVAKDAAQVEAGGDLDELSAALGMVRAEPLPADTAQLVERLQHELFVVGAELAAAGTAGPDAPRIGPQHVQALEQAIDRYAAATGPPKGFVLPGGTRPAAGLHFARTVCRRAERRLVALARLGQPPLSPALLAYINRLGDLLFVLARAVNARASLPESQWPSDDSPAPSGRGPG